MRRHVLPVVVMFLCLGAARPPLSLVAGQRFTPTPKSQTSEVDQSASLKGEQVVLLAKPKGYQDAPFGFGEYGARTAATPSKNLTEEYSGKTGTIVDVKLIGRDTEFTIALDGSDEHVLVRDKSYLGFFAAKRLAETFVGRTLWTKGRLYLDDPNKALPATTKLHATGVEWGAYNDTVALSLKTDEGREGQFKFGLQRCLDNRFSSVNCERAWSVEDDFFTQDPHTLFPQWSADAWKLVTSGMVAVGMTEEMVKAVCGSGLRMTGAVLSDAGKMSSIYSCIGAEGPFLIENGKVAKFMTR